MADVLTDFSRASMAQAVEANLFAFFQHVARWPRVELHDEADCCWTLSDLPFPLFNSVMRARLAGDRIWRVFGKGHRDRIDGKLQTIMEAVEHGKHVFRAYWKHAWVKQ